MVIAISLILFLGILGGMGGLVVWQLKKTDPKRADTSLKNDIKTAQEFLPFQDIKDSMINLGNHEYRAILDVSSINYNLKTKKEKDILELSYQRFLNSMDFAYTIFLQTKTMDNTKVLNLLKADVEETLKEFPHLEKYARSHVKNMESIHDRTGTNKQKKKYIIVPYNDAIALTNLSDDEKYVESAKELYNRCQLVVDGLESMGLRAEILTTNDVAALITSVYHRDNHNHIEGIVDGDYLETFVQGETKMADILAEGKLDLILVEARHKLESELREDKGTPKEVLEATEQVIREIEKLRDQFAGYYSSNISLDHTIPEEEIA